jgi:hypothetical protein
VRQYIEKVSADVIHYTCMHCGKVSNLPDDKRETVFTCPACQFSNWVSGMAVAEPEAPAPRFRQEAPPPPARPPGGPSPAPRPAVGHPAPRRPAAAAAQSQVSQPHPAPKISPPAPKAPPTPPPKISPPPPPQIKAPGQTPAPTKAPPTSRPGAVPPKPLSGLDRNLELLQRDSTSAARPQYHPRPAPPENQKSEICPEAIGAFLLGLLSVLSLVGPIPLTVILSLVALGLSAKAKTKIDAEPARLRGAGLTSIAAFLGVLGLIGSVLVKGCR